MNRPRALRWLLTPLLGTLAAAAPAASPRVRSIELVTHGMNTAYSEALERIAFARFHPEIKVGDDLGGGNDGTGTFELWRADPDGANERCLTCADVPGGPRRNQHKGAPTWHPSGEWIVAAVEMPVHLAPHAKCHAGFGAYVDLWALSPDGRRWRQLTRYANAAYRTRFPDQPVGAL